MATAREILTKWGFDVETDKLTAVERQLEGIKGRLDAFATIAVIKKLFGLAQHFSHLGQEIQVAAENAGISTAEYQELAYSATMGAVGTDRLTMSLARFSQMLYAARNGGKEALATLHSLGFTDAQVKGFKNSREALLALADRLKGISDPIKRAAIAQTVLGRGNSRMVAWLAKGSEEMRQQGLEAHRLGAILSEDQINALADFNNAMQRTGFIMRAFSAGMAAYIAPIFHRMIDDFVAFYEANEKIIRINFEKWLTRVAYGMGFAWGLVKLGTNLVLDLGYALGQEDNMVSFFMGLISIILGLAAFAKAIRLTKAILLSSVDGITTVVSGFLWMKNTILGLPELVAGFVVRLAALAETLGLTTAATWLLNAALWVAELPFWVIIAAIAALIFIGHELWAFFTGKPTWLGWMWEWVSSFEAVKASIQWIKDHWAWLGALGGVARLGIAAGEKLAERNSDINSSSAGGSAPVADWRNSLGGGAPSYSMQTEVNMTIPPNLSPEMAQAAIRDGLSDHLDRQRRELQASTAPVRRY